MLADLAAQQDGHWREPRAGARNGSSTRRRVTIVCAVIVVVAGAGVGTAAAFGLFSARPTDRHFATCYATDDLAATDNHLDITVATSTGADLSEKDAANSAMDICTGAWQQGRLSRIDPKVREDPQPPPWNRPVPPLIACVLASGQVGVFPGNTETCQHLGLPVAEL